VGRTNSILARNNGALWLRAAGAAAALCAVHTGAARATCLPPPTPELVSLAQMASRDPETALKDLVQQEGAARRTAAPIETLAWLRAIQTSAYWQLGREPDAETRIAVSPDLDRRSAAQVQLLIQDVFRDFRPETLQASIPQLEAARKDHAAGSAADICLQATLGNIQQLAGDYEAAAPNLIAAYRQAHETGDERQRAYAAYALAMFMRAAGDYPRALQLHAERTAWDEKMGHRFKLPVDYFITGRLLQLSGKSREALPWLARAVAEGSDAGDTGGVVHFQLEQCAALTSLKDVGRAQPLCEQVAQDLRSIDPGGLRQAQLYLADLALQQGQPAASLVLLNAALAASSTVSASFDPSAAYRLKSAAHAALGDSAAAYRDLLEHTRLQAQEFAREQALQIIAGEAEMTAQTQMARNLRLQQELQAAQARSREQTALIMGIITASAFIIMLLLAVNMMARRNRRSLERAADIDLLTGLFNRRKTVELTEAALQSARNDGAPLSVAIIDLDYFKQINDNYGHPVGDEVLKRFAAVMQANIRATDVLGRWGGEEFLLVMPNSTADIATAVIERIRDSATRLQILQTPKPGVAFSAGITTASGTVPTMEALIAQADSALYAAKNAGRGRTSRWDTETQIFPGPAPSRRSIRA